jgi:hypothetical protein
MGAGRGLWTRASDSPTPTPGPGSTTRRNTRTHAFNWAGSSRQNDDPVRLNLGKGITVVTAIMGRVLQAPNVTVAMKMTVCPEVVLDQGGLAPAIRQKRLAQLSWRRARAREEVAT